MIEVEQQPASAPSLLTYEQAAERLGISVSTLKAHKAAGNIRVMKTGYRTVRIRSVELEKFKQRHER
jgi:excisionase family DNA binding protein